MSILPPECNCRAIKLMDTPCPLHGYLNKPKEKISVDDLKDGLQVGTSDGLSGLPDEAEVWQKRTPTRGNRENHGTCVCEAAIAGMPNTPNRWLCKTCGRWIHYNKRETT